MTYCIRNAAFFDFRWTYTMRTLHNSECSSSLRRSLISSHSNHMMTHTIFISGFDTFYCRFLASFMIGLLRFFILMKSSSYGFLQNLTHMLWHSFDIIATLLQENASILLSLLPSNIRHFQPCVQATKQRCSKSY
jgi:hypothetical protein